MEDRLIAHFQRYIDLKPEEIDAIIKSMVIRKYSQKSRISYWGNEEPTSFFVLEGLVREYVMVNDEEFTTNFYREGDWIVNLYHSDESSGSVDHEPNTQLVCLEETAMVAGNNQKAKELFLRFPRLESVARSIIEDSLAQHQKRMRDFRTQSPEQRLKTLLANQPDLFQRVSQVHLSNFIGVRPESLSRIRKRIYEREKRS